MTLSLEARGLLTALDDYSVGGRSVTPAAPSYSNLKVKRVGIKTEDDWTLFEAVHINPARKSLRTACESLGVEFDSSLMDDRVLLLDFDNYSKDGIIKVPEATSPHQLIHRLKSLGMPLPYCIMQSGTPGNFHALWVYKTPQDRNVNKYHLRLASLYWGSDPEYTNSTMRNPLYLEAHQRGRVTWWTSWASMEPLLGSAGDLVPRGFEAEVRKKSKTVKNSTNLWVPSNRGNFKDRLSDSQLEAVMREATDGSGRWHMIKSWIIRRINESIINNERPLNSKEVWEALQQGNSLFAEPMDNRRLEEIKKYWSEARQKSYFDRQTIAGSSNYQAKENHEEALKRYFYVLDFKTDLEHHTKVAIGELTPELQALDRQYEGKRVAPRGGLCYDYIAWMLQVQPKLVVDPSTGEVLKEISPATQVKNILVNGKRYGYTREEYLELTNDQRCVNIGETIPVTA